VCFLEAFVTSVGIRALTYLSLMANRQDNNQHNNDDDEVDNLVLSRAKFYEFRDETQKFHDNSQQFLEET